MIKGKKHISSRGESIVSVVRHLREGYEVEYVPRGNDMLPLIRGGKDIITLHPLDRELRRGDIVLVELHEHVYGLRRIIDRNQNRIWVMAESNFGLDALEECTLNDMVGQVVLIQRGHMGFRPGKGHFWMLLLPVRGAIMKCYKHFWKENVDKDSQSE